MKSIELNNKLCKEARAKAAVRLGGELKVTAALGNGMETAMLALQTPFLGPSSPLSQPQYLRPCEAPLFKRNAARHAAIRSRVAAVIGARKVAMTQREELLASRYIHQRNVWRERVEVMEQRMEKRRLKTQRGSRRSRDDDSGNPLSLGRFGGALMTDLEEKQVMELIAERERREAVRQATIMDSTVAQLPPEIRAAQVVMYVLGVVDVDAVPRLTVWLVALQQHKCQVHHGRGAAAVRRYATTRAMPVQPVQLRVGNGGRAESYQPVDGRGEAHLHRQVPAVPEKLLQGACRARAVVCAPLTVHGGARPRYQRSWPTSRAGTVSRSTMTRRS